MSKWPQVPLGNVARVVGAKASPSGLDDLTPYLGLEHIEPNARRPALWGAAGEVTSLVNTFEPGDTLFGRLRPYLHKVALADRAGVCTPEILVLRPANGAIAPGFLHLVASSEAVIDEAVRLSSGTRMPRTSAKDLLSMEVMLPPLDIQLRIVHLVDAFDSNIASLKAEAADLAAVLEATLDLSFPIAGGGTRALGEFVTARSGPSWAATDETSQPVEGATPVVKITNTRPDGSWDTGQLAYVRGLPASTTTLNESSIVVIRTNGNRTRIGNTYLPPADVFGAAVSAFQFHVEVTEPAARNYVYWFLRAPKTQTAMSAAASGTTGLGNLALKTLRALEVPWPEEPIRDDICATLRQLQDAVDCLRAEAEALRGVRAALLPALLSGHLEVPESYDDLVGAL